MFLVASVRLSLKLVQYVAHTSIGKRASFISNYISLDLFHARPSCQILYLFKTSRKALTCPTSLRCLTMSAMSWESLPLGSPKPKLWRKQIKIQIHSGY